MARGKATSAAREAPTQRVSAPPRCAWIEFEAPEVIELKRILLDRDAEGTVAFFQDVVVPKVRAAAERHGIPLPADEEGDDERLPG